MGDVDLRVRPEDGGWGSVVRLPEADHQGHSERLALLRFPGALGLLNPGLIDKRGLRRAFLRGVCGWWRPLLSPPREGGTGWDRPIYRRRSPVGSPCPRASRVKYQVRGAGVKYQVRRLGGGLEQLVGLP